VAPAVQPLAVERTSKEGVELLLVEGELDIATAPRLISVLNGAVQEALRSLVVDLSDVDFMDSTGLALLINAHRRLTRRSKGFAVVCPPGPLRRVFEVTDMVDMLRVCPDRASARAAATA
jgi:anti-sigma B factor antagonist